MKSKKTKRNSTSPRSSEENSSSRNAFSFLKHRFFVSNTEQPLLTSPRPSSSSNMKSWSIDNLEQHDEDHQSMPDSNTCSFSSSSSSSSCSTSKTKNTRPMSMMAIDSLTQPTTSPIDITTRRRNSTNTMAINDEKEEKRNSLIILKEGYLYKKSDFKPFHRQAKLDRGWKLYKVVLRGHKLYFYKIASESPLRSLFPLSPTSQHKHQSQPSLTYSLSASSIASASMTMSPVASEFDQEAQQILFSHSLSLYGTIFMELNQTTQQPKQQVYLVLAQEALYVCRRIENVWKIKTDYPLHALQAQIHDRDVFQFSLFFQQTKIGTYSTQYGDLGQAWISMLHSRMYDATQELNRSHRSENHCTTIHALVHQLLTTEEDSVFSDTFLLTWSTFTTGSRVLNEIKACLTQATELRVIQLFRGWCQQFALDVIGDVATGMVDILSTLSHPQAKETKDLVLKIVHENAKKTHEHSSTVNLVASSHTEEQEDSTDIENIKAHHSNHKRRDSINLSNLLITGLTPSLFLSMDTFSFAQQICLFHTIKYNQFGQDLLNPLSFLPRPQIPIQMSNSLVFTPASPHFLTKLIWVHILIENQQDEGTTEDCTFMRSQLLSHWIRVGLHLFELGDTMGWCAIALGVCSVGIVRLRETWKAVDRDLVSHIQTDWVPLLTEYGLFTQEIGADYWSKQAMVCFSKVLQIHPTGLPFFGTLRQSVDRFKKHAKNTLCTPTIDFEECQFIHDIITTGLHEWQQRQPSFEPAEIPDIVPIGPLQSYFEHSVTDIMSVPHDYKHLQECSLACEPRIFGQGFQQRQNKTSTATVADVAPPSTASLKFPNILDSCTILDIRHQDTLSQQKKSRKTKNKSILESDYFLPNKKQPVTKSHESNAPSTNKQGKMIRQRTYSFPPGGTRLAHHENPTKLGDLFEQENSRTWLGSLISNRHHRTFSTKAFIHAHRNSYGHQGDMFLNTQHGELVFKATALLKNEHDTTKDDDTLLVTLKAGSLEQLVDVLATSIAPFEDMLKEQWHMIPLAEGFDQQQPSKIATDEEEYIHVFFTTYRTFCSPAHLLEMFQQRFVDAKTKARHPLKRKGSLILLESYFSPTHAQGTVNAYDWKQVASIQLRILNLLLYWMEEHPYDFVDEAKIIRYVASFLKHAKMALEEWSRPLKDHQGHADTVLLAEVIEERLNKLSKQFVQKIMSPIYDMKAIAFDPERSRGIEGLYRQLTNTTQRYHTTLQLVTNKSQPLSLTSQPRVADAKSLVDSFAPEVLLEQVDRVVRQLFSAVTMQDWIQTFDVFEAQASDLYAWLPARKPSRTSRMSAVLSAVIDSPSSHLTTYHILSEEVIVSDIFTAIEGARRSVVSPSAFSDDDLLLAFPGSIQYLYCIHFIIRSWVIHEIADMNIDSKTRVLRIEKFLQIVLTSKTMSEKLTLFPEGRVPGFVEYAIANALVSPEIRLFSKAWHDVAMQHGHASLDTLESLLNQMQKTQPVLGHSRPSTLSSSYSLSSISSGQHHPWLVPSLGWIFERMLELCFHVPDAYEARDYMINFDKRRCITQFLRLVQNVQTDLDEQPVETKSINMSFLLSPNESKHTWKDLRELAARENKKQPGNLVLRAGPRTTVFNKLVTEQMEKLKRYFRDRDRIDKEWLSFQHKLQKKQLEQARQADKQDRKTNQAKSSTTLPSHQLQQHSVMPRINSFLKGLRPHSMAAFPPHLHIDHPSLFPHLSSIKASTVINLIHATTSVASTYTKRDFVFRIVTEEGGQYLLQGMSREDMQDWMQYINSSSREGAAKRQSVLAADSINVDPIVLPNTETRSKPFSRTSVFGVPLDSLIRDHQIPLVVDKCIQEIERRGLEEVGIYRVAGTGSVVSALKTTFNKDVSKVDLSDPLWADINVVADTLKQFLRELPEPLLTYTYYDELINAAALEDHDERVYLLKKIIKKLPYSNYLVLKRIIEHFVTVTDFEATNHMYATNLAIVFGPTLLQPSPSPTSFATTMSNIGHHQTVVKYLILNYHYLFDVELDEAEAFTKDEEQDTPSSS